jgi:hypothetical protein
MGLDAVEHYLNRRHPNEKPSTFFLYQLTKFILTKNNFRFMDKNYLQQQGTAMGTRMAPSYANIVMGRLEEKFLNSQTQKPSMWIRFIDDIFMIWPHGQTALTKFINNLNNCSPLKFTHERQIKKQPSST